MAVWMLIIGKKVFQDGLARKVEESKQVIAHLQLDLSFLKGTLEPDPMLLEIARKNLLANYYIYDPSKWILKTHNDAVHLYYPLYKNRDYKGDSLSIHLYNDLIAISGPFDHFQKWFLITENENLSRGYQQVVEGICKSFEVKKVVYFSEWFCSSDQFDKYEELEKILLEYQERQVRQLFGMDGNQYYIEDLQE